MPALLQYRPVLGSCLHSAAFRSEGLQLLYKIRFDAAYPCKWGTLPLTSPSLSTDGLRLPHLQTYAALGGLLQPFNLSRRICKGHEAFAIERIK